MTSSRFWTKMIWACAVGAMTVMVSEAADNTAGADNALSQYVNFAAQQNADQAERTVAQGEVSPARQSDPMMVQASETSAETIPLEEGDAPPAEEGTIQLTFKDSEQDILTRQAMDKLDVMVDSLVFPDAKLSNVIRTIGERLNINFIFDSEDITGNVTLRMHNVRLRDALDSILTTRKLAIIPDRSGIFRIVPQEQVGKKSIETRTDILQMNWISAADIVKTMKPFLSDDGKMEFNEESNSIIITDVPPRIAEIRDLIAKIDIPERQVLIEARLVDVNVNAARELGTEWNMTKRNDDLAIDNTGINNGVASGDNLGVVNNLLEGLTFTQGKGTLGFGDQVSVLGNTFDLNAAFTALETRNIVQILANPRVTTLNNVPAKIRIIQRIPYIEAEQGLSGNSVTATVKFEDSGVEIFAKPIITPNDFVRIEIKLKQTIFRGRVGDSALDPPLMDERNAETNIIVSNNNTVVLGGLRQHQATDGTSGVPWLHQTPLLGWLFKSKNYFNEHIELVLMVTPKIIKQQLPLTDTEKYWYDRIDDNWNLPDYFFDQTDSYSQKQADKVSKLKELQGR